MALDNVGNGDNEINDAVDWIWELIEKHGGNQGAIYREIAERIVKAESTVAAKA